MVGILGGMGPAAGADFVRLFVQACTERMVALGIPVLDQAYPEHWLAQVPVPDRTAALNDPREGAHQPLDSMLQATGRLAALGVRVPTPSTTPSQPPPFLAFAPIHSVLQMWSLHHRLTTGYAY